MQFSTLPLEGVSLFSFSHVGSGMRTQVYRLDRKTCTQLLSFLFSEEDSTELWGLSSWQRNMYKCIHLSVPKILPYGFQLVLNTSGFKIVEAQRHKAQR